MNIKELRKKNTEDLTKELHASLQERFSLRMQKGLGETPRTHRIKEVRREVARIKTILNENKKVEDHGAKS